MARSASLAAGGLALIVLAAGCQDREEYGSVPPVPSAPPSAQPTRALTAGERQVADQYLRYVRALERLYATADPARVDMSAVAPGEQLRKVVAIAVRMRGRGEHAVGQFADTVTSVAQSGDSAELVSCQDANAVRVRSTATGQVVAPAERFPRRVQRVTLARVRGHWLVSAVRNDGAC
jgi:hypothetical protein